MVTVGTLKGVKLKFPESCNKVSILLILSVCIYVSLLSLTLHSSRIGDVDDLPDMRVDASSPGPRVTFNIQDVVNLF